MGSVAHLNPPWQPGQSGNPKGRPKGSRNKLEEAFLADLVVSWERDGVDAIKRAVARQPMAYLQMVASLLPKHVEGSSALDGITREQLGTAITALESWIATSGTEEARPRAGEPEPPSRLSTIPEAD